MKVRRKADPPRGEYEVKTETDHSYLTVDGYELNKDYYEPVETEPRWQDVTGECSVLGNDEILDHTPGCFVASLTHAKQRGYRLRKVRVLEGDPSSLKHKVVWAFIVERKVG